MNTAGFRARLARELTRWNLSLRHHVDDVPGLLRFAQPDGLHVQLEQGPGLSDTRDVGQ